MAKLKEGFEGMLQFEKLVNYKLAQISRDPEHPITLDCISEYEQARFVPEDKQAALQNMLNAEIDARKRLGDEAYFTTQSVAVKVEAYDMALNQIMDEMVERCTVDMPMTWTEFRQRVSRAVMEISKERWGYEDAD